jgi:hypothetical protein
MVDVFEQISTNVSTSQTPAFHHRLQGFIWATRRKIKKRVRGYLPNMSHNRPEYLRHRYPDVSMDDVRSRISRFRQILGNSSKLRIERLHDRFFRIDRR